MEANENPVVDGAPLWVFFLALDTKLVQVFPNFSLIFFGQITFDASVGLWVHRFFFLVLVKHGLVRYVSLSEWGTHVWKGRRICGSARILTKAVLRSGGSIILIVDARVKAFGVNEAYWYSFQPTSLCRWRHWILKMCLLFEWVGKSRWGISGHGRCCRIVATHSMVQWLFARVNRYTFWLRIIILHSGLNLNIGANITGVLVLIKLLWGPKNHSGCLTLGNIWIMFRISQLGLLYSPARIWGFPYRVNALSIYSIIVLAELLLIPSSGILGFFHFYYDLFF